MYKPTPTNTLLNAPGSSKIVVTSGGRPKEGLLLMTSGAPLAAPKITFCGPNEFPKPVFWSMSIVSEIPNGFITVNRMKSSVPNPPAGPRQLLAVPPMNAEQPESVAATVGKLFHATQLVRAGLRKMVADAKSYSVPGEDVVVTTVESTNVEMRSASAGALAPKRRAKRMLANKVKRFVILSLFIASVIDR